MKAMRDTSSPERIVEVAQTYSQGDPHKGIDSGQYTHIWVAFDWDGNTDQVRRAIKAANNSKIKVALSNPSFEVWIIWHFKQYRQYGCSCDDVALALKRCWPRYAKGDACDFASQYMIREGMEDARRQARNMRQFFNDNGYTFPEDRPSSDIDKLINEIIHTWEQARPGEQCPLGGYNPS